MDNLKKEQKDEYATAFAILALYDGGVSSSSSIVTQQHVFVGVCDVHLTYVLWDVVPRARKASPHGL